MLRFGLHSQALQTTHQLPSIKQDFFWNSLSFNTSNPYSSLRLSHHVHDVSCLVGSPCPNTVPSLANSYSRRLSHTGKAHRERWKLRQLFSRLLGGSQLCRWCQPIRRWERRLRHVFLRQRINNPCRRTVSLLVTHPHTLYWSNTL